MADIALLDRDAVLFDLDGVLTPTADIHRAAWKAAFDEELRRRAGADGEFDEFTDADYLDHVDGKPRQDGVRDFLASRGIHLPLGDPEDATDVGTVWALGNRKNEVFATVLERDGVRPYPGSLRVLDALAERGVPMAVVSSSRNARLVLEAARITDRFAVTVDGLVAAELGLSGKPAPDSFLHAASALGVDPGGTVVVEDALSGVAAGAAGRFGLVVGVDRGAGADELAAHGADIVVTDLEDLL